MHGADKPALVHQKLMSSVQACLPMPSHVQVADTADSARDDHGCIVLCTASGYNWTLEQNSCSVCKCTCVTQRKQSKCTGVVAND